MSSIYDKAISFLKMRPHHSEELRQKLRIRGFDGGQIDEVILKLTQEGQIDNESFAQIYLDELLRNKTFGFYGFKSKLMQRGIPADEADRLLKDSLSLEEEKQIAQRVVERERKIDKVKLAQKLSRKGFRSEVIHSFLRDA